MAESFKTTLLAVLVVGFPIAAFVGISSCLPGTFTPSPLLTFQTTFPLSKLSFSKSLLGKAPKGRPLITNVQVVDLDQDRIPDILVCDASANRVVWYRQAPRGTWTERVLGDVDLAAPCHASVVDLDQDGKLDLVVAVLGSVFPTDDPVGKVVWLRNEGNEDFKTRVLLDDLRRVADVRAGDLNGDGLLDLAVAEFGYDRGRVLWLENKGKGQFQDHELMALPGAIHVPIVDLNGDGKPDLVTVFSQEDEEVIAFENLGGGKFRHRSLHAFPNFDFGSSGLFVTDLNGDKKPDLLLTGGDNLEITYPAAQPWHGCVLLENQGDWKFKPRRLANVPGVYAAAVDDLNGDGHADIVLASMFNDWHQRGSASLVWLENDGKGNFQTWQIADAPSHLATVDVGDVDGDGRPDIVAGSLHLMGPYNRLGRVSLWTSRPGGPR